MSVMQLDSDSQSFNVHQQVENWNLQCTQRRYNWSVQQKVNIKILFYVFLGMW